MSAADILVVDDNPANLRLVSFLLRQHGHVVRTAVDAQGALAAIHERLPLLVLMDLQLPGMDGLALTRALKADEATRAPFVVAFTASAMKGDEQRALDAGCDAYLTKPIDTRTLPATIASYLAGAESRRGDLPR